MSNMFSNMLFFHSTCVLYTYIRFDMFVFIACSLCKSKIPWCMEIIVSKNEFSYCKCCFWRNEFLCFLSLHLQNIFPEQQKTTKKKKNNPKLYSMKYFIILSIIYYLCIYSTTKFDEIFFTIQMKCHEPKTYYKQIDFIWSTPIITIYKWLYLCIWSSISNVNKNAFDYSYHREKQCYYFVFYCSSRADNSRKIYNPQHTPKKLKKLKKNNQKIQK